MTRTLDRTTSVVVLGRFRTPVERDLIERWARVEHPGAVVVRDGGTGVGDGLGDPATLVVPARVAWLPATARPVDRLLAHVTPAVPWSAGRARTRIVAGEPATLGELRERFAGEADGAASFGAYVSRVATVACDRADRAVRGDRYKVPRQVAEQIAASARFAGKVRELADRLGRPVDEVAAQARECLGELVAVQSQAAIDAYLSVLAPLHAPAWTVHADQGGLERLRELNRKQALVFLPAHRSYVDPLVLAGVLQSHDFPLNHVLGGNNMAIGPIGLLGRRAGVVFIRRRNAGDRVYKLALQEYLGHLVAKRFNLEWYIEGGRSRTGKLRPPKVGLLAYLVRALEEGRTDDVALVPVSISYDRMHELAALDAEQAGAEKKAESLRWLLGFVRGQRRTHGNAWVRFGEPFSLREALDAAGDGPARLDKVAFRICDGINRATPVTATALVTFALLGTRGRALTIDQVDRVAQPLVGYLRRRGIAGAQDAPSGRSALRETLDRLVEAGVASRFDGGTEPVWSIREGQHRIAAFYRNGGVHHLVTRAVVELALVHIASGAAAADVVDAAWAEALRLRDLLKFEFFFPPTERFREQVDAELELIDPRWPQRVGSEAGARELLTSTRLLVAHRALRTFLDAQLVVLETLAGRHPGVALDEEPFLAECLGIGQQMLLQGRVDRPESVSRELYATALKLAEHRGLLTRGGDEARRATVAQVRDVLDRMNRLDRIERDLVAELLEVPA